MLGGLRGFWRLWRIFQRRFAGKMFVGGFEVRSGNGLTYGLRFAVLAGLRQGFFFVPVER